MNLFAFKHGTPHGPGRTAAEIVMRERLIRLIHFPDTIPFRHQKKCSTCGKRGHRADNQKFHPS